MRSKLIAVAIAAGLGVASFTAAAAPQNRTSATTNAEVELLKAQLAALQAKVDELEQRTDAQSDINVSTGQAVEKATAVTTASAKKLASLEKLAAKSIPEARHRIYMPPVIDSVARPGQESEERVEVIIDADRCNGCGLCAAFCPESVLETEQTGGAEKARVIAGEKCCACYTCVGQCPQQAIQIIV